MDRTTESRTIRLKRLRYRSWHRGTREMDLLLGRFADAFLTELSDLELDHFETVLGCADQDLYGWVTGERSWPEPLDCQLTRSLTRFASRSLRR